MIIIDKNRSSIIIDRNRSPRSSDLLLSEIDLLSILIDNYRSTRSISRSNNTNIKPNLCAGYYDFCSLEVEGIATNGTSLVATTVLVAASAVFVEFFAASSARFAISSAFNSSSVGG